MITVTKRFGWAMGHRLVDGYEGKCTNPHGHNYELEVTVTTEKLNDVGMVIDFSGLKEVVKRGIEKLDHCFLVCERDAEMIHFFKSCTGKTFKNVIVPFNTTAENIVKWLGVNLDDQLRALERVSVSRLRLYETPDSWAEWRST